MFMTIMPFACIGIGIAIGFQNLSARVLKVVDGIVTVMLVVLMMTIGGNIGTNQEVIANIPTIGLNCLLLCLGSIALSVLLCYIVEKTLLPLDKIKEKIQNARLQDLENAESKIETTAQGKDKKDPILYIIPISLIVGAVGCYLFMPQNATGVLDVTLLISLVCLYTGAGISIGANKGVFQFMKEIGWRIVLLFLGVLIGSIAAGLIGGLLLDAPLNVALISTAGMGYYSMSGANLLSWFGPEAGVYGFMVNVLRDFFTVLLLPILVKIGKSAPIASSAGGGMDTMLVPVTRILGPELGLVTMIIGVLCTFAVPILQPILCNLLN